MDPFIKITHDQLAVQVSAPRFTDLWMVGWYSSPSKTRAGKLEVHPWSGEQIDMYYRQVERWERFGQPMITIARACGRHRITGGAFGYIAKRHDIPLHMPADRSKVISNCTFLQGDTGFSIAMPGSKAAMEVNDFKESAEDPFRQDHGGR